MAAIRFYPHVAKIQGIAMNIEFPLNHAKPEISKDTLVKDIKIIASDVDNLLKDVGSATVEEASAAWSNIETRIGDMRARLHEARIGASDKADRVAHLTYTYVNENPWKSLGIASIAGLAIGVLLSRR